MHIFGPDALVFGVDDVTACAQFLTDYGLHPRDAGRFEALDGTYVMILARDDPSLPPPFLGTASMLRKTVYGVADAATLNAIAAELGRDRVIKHMSDGSIESVDDMGFVLGFQVSIRRPIHMPSERVNAPGDQPQRGVNQCGVPTTGSIVPQPRTLSHVVYFVPDAAKAEAFYAERLRFRTTDRFVDIGPFMRPAGTLDHHTLFLIQTPEFMKGVEHFTFHMGGPTEVLAAGTQFVNKGYESFWGPGRHRFGSNWFWYFNSPLGCHVEYDADMDLHDKNWVPRTAPPNADTSQTFLFRTTEKWYPGGPPTKAAVPR